MKTVLGKWRLNNDIKVEIKWSKDLGYYAELEDKYVKDHFYYNDEGECYRQRRVNAFRNTTVDDVSRGGDINRSALVECFQKWDLKELIEAEEKVEEIKRNSNPIFMLDVCTE